MTRQLLRKRCFNHADREAAAICLECGRYFCRECITEHHDRVLCAVCLSKTADQGAGKGSGMSFLLNALFFLGALFFLWFSFYAVGQLLLKLPVSFHEGTLWKNIWPDM